MIGMLSHPVIERLNLKEVEDAVDLLLVRVARRVCVGEVCSDARSNVTEEQRSTCHEDDVEEELPVVDGKQISVAEMKAMLN